MRLPEVIIGGAPKCGTSSLAGWLDAHPGTCRSTIKETFFFMDPDNPLRRAEANAHEHDLGRYLRYFDHCTRPSAVLFEATTHYLYQQTALEAFAQWDPRPRLIFVLRDPAQRVRSSFQFSKNTLATVDSSTTFDDYVQAILARDEPRLDSLLGTSASAFVLKRDVSYSQYIDHLRPWVEQMGRERVTILLFEDLVRDPRGSMTRLAGVLGISPDPFRSTLLSPRNQTIHVRWRRLHRLARRIRKTVPSMEMPRIARSLYFQLQSRRDSPSPFRHEQAMDALREHFQPYNERLRLELGIETTAWQAPASQRPRSD